MSAKNPNQLTPYQGRRRCYGYFRCTRCSHTWESGNSWANTGQKCTYCSGVMVYPYRQKPLERSLTKTATKGHMEELCGKCITLGYCCKVLKNSDVKTGGGGSGQQKQRGRLFNSEGQSIIDYLYRQF